MTSLPDVTDATVSTCPACSAEVDASAAFCENCGANLGSEGDPAVDGDNSTTALDSSPLSDSPINLSTPVRATDEPTLPMRRPCLSCGGVVGADGYCETCGSKAPSERDHYVEQPASWVAASCDRGIRHHRNEDATAIAAERTPAAGRC